VTEGEEILDWGRKKEERLCEGRSINQGLSDDRKMKKNKIKGIMKRLVFNEMGIIYQKKIWRRRGHV
jgi:hypothetical protein